MCQKRLPVRSEFQPTATIAIVAMMYGGAVSP